MLTHIGYRSELYVGTLPTATVLMVLVQEDFEYDKGGEVGAVSYGLYTGDGSPSV